MTLRKYGIEIEIGCSKSHCSEKSLWKNPCT